jgi:probable rRNA maturation factor
MNVSVFNSQRAWKINLLLLKQIAETLLAELEIQDAELEVNLVAATEMTRLNEKFLQHAGSTDVIAFNYGENGRAGCPQAAAKPSAIGTSRPTLHGEIFICLDEAVRQACKFRTSWQSEITRYLVHGVLHLLGYNDALAEERQKMKRVEDRLLRRLFRRFSLAQLARPAKLSACKSP